MLEFYWAYATYEDLMNFAEKMAACDRRRSRKAMPEAHAKWLAERPFTFAESFVRLPMADAVANAARATKIPAWVRRASSRS